MDAAVLFASSAAALLRLVERIGDDQWTLPGLGEWDVRGLTGHASRAISTVEVYLLADAPVRATVSDALGYYAALAGGRADPAAVARRGVETGALLGARPAAAIAESLRRTTALLEQQPAGRLVAIGGASPAVALALDEYLRTRVLELVVHTIDLSRATGLAHELPPEAVEASAALAGALAARAGRGEELLLALTGRERLPDGFTVV